MPVSDILIIGGGPAGVSAALTARNRGKSVKIITNDPSLSNLSKAEKIDNYPGLSGISGKELQSTLTEQAKNAGVEYTIGRSINAMSSSNGFFVAVGQDFYEGKSLIITSGVSQKNPFPGETEFLGKGLSYCATCDGMLYRGKNVAVIGLSHESVEEANFLKGIGCSVSFFGKKNRPDGLLEGIEYHKSGKYEIKGGAKAEILVADGEEYAVNGIFLLRDTVSADSFFPGLETDNGHIKVDKSMKTNVPGVFAAGDCIGPPYQIPKAVGEGNIAALSAAEFLSK